MPTFPSDSYYTNHEGLHASRAKNVRQEKKKKLRKRMLQVLHPSNFPLHLPPPNLTHISEFIEVRNLR